MSETTPPTYTGPSTGNTDPNAFTAVMKRFFGLKEGQSIMQFAAELKTLSYEDKLEFAAQLNAAGIPCSPPAKPKVP